MQGVTVDEQKHRISCIDDDLLNLRPSPNFKHKKYLRSKFEEALLVEAKSFSLGPNKREKVNNALKSGAAAQPPLPPNPPPPDTPPMIIHLKQEIEDDEYTSSTVEFNQPDEQKAGPLPVKPAPVSPDQAEKVTMCRNFARGTCRKGPTCIFAHELILSQLPGVYTFCRNFQNSVCSFPKCKFVHATVFEKEHFFRTGYLPPHTLAHLEESNGLRAHLPPPHSGAASVEQPVGAAVEQPPVYSNGQLTTTIPCNENVVRYPGEIAVDRSDPNIFNAVPSVTSTTSPKAWSDIDDVTRSPRYVDSDEPPRKCEKCAPLVLRERLLKNKVTKLTRANKRTKDMIARIEKNNTVLATVLGPYYKTHTAPDKFTLPSERESLFQILLSNNNSSITSALAKLMLAKDKPRSESS